MTACTFEPVNSAWPNAHANAAWDDGEPSTPTTIRLFTAHLLLPTANRVPARREVRYPTAEGRSFPGTGSQRKAVDVNDHSIACICMLRARHGPRISMRLRSPPDRYFRVPPT